MRNRQNNNMDGRRVSEVANKKIIASFRVDCRVWILQNVRVRKAKT